MSTFTVAEQQKISTEKTLTLPDALRSTLLDAAFVGVACVLFLGLSLYQLQRPGLYADEAFDVIPAMQLLQGHTVELQRNIGLHLFDLDLPLMSSSDYQGVTSTYLVLPFFALGGINVVSLRLMTVTVGLIGVILTYFLARAWFGRGAARLAVLLIAVSPSWIFFSRLGVYVVSQVMPIAVGSLLAFTLWVRRKPLGKRNGLLYLGTFLLGLGLTTKLLFLWFIAAIVIVACILWGRPIWESRRTLLTKRARWLKMSVIGGFWFLVGASPFLVYNLLSGGTFNLLRHTLSAPGSTGHGVNNSAFLRNLWTEADAFKALLDGGYFWFQGVLGATYSNPLTPALFAISALGLVCLILLEHQDRNPLRYQVLPRVGTVLLGSGLLVALILATGFLSGSAAGVLVLAIAILSLTGMVLLVGATLISRAAWSEVAWLLLMVATIAGALWWYGGAGRPEGPATGAFLGLWPIDAAGVVFWTAGTGLVLMFGLDTRPVPYQRAITAMLALIGLIVAQSAVTVSGLWSTHLLVLLPLPQITIAAFAILAGKKWASRLTSRTYQPLRQYILGALAILLVGAPILFDLNVVRSYHRDLALTGGRAAFSDAIYSLANYLDNRSVKGRVIALDWGFKRPIQLLTLERVNPEDDYGYEEPASQATIQSIANLVKQPDALFLFHIRDVAAYQRFDIFSAAVHDSGKQPVLERTFYERDGMPVYEVYSVR